MRQTFQSTLSSSFVFSDIKTEPITENTTFGITIIQNHSPILRLGKSKWTAQWQLCAVCVCANTLCRRCAQMWGTRGFSKQPLPLTYGFLHFGVSPVTLAGVTGALMTRIHPQTQHPFQQPHNYFTFFLPTFLELLLPFLIFSKVRPFYAALKLPALKEV